MYPSCSPKQLIVWENLQHDDTTMESPEQYEVQMQGTTETYVVIPKLHAGEAVQTQYEPDHSMMQLDNGLVSRNRKSKPHAPYTLYKEVSKCQII